MAAEIYDRRKKGSPLSIVGVRRPPLKLKLLLHDKHEIDEISLRSVEAVRIESLPVNVVWIELTIG